MNHNPSDRYIASSSYLSSNISYRKYSSDRLSSEASSSDGVLSNRERYYGDILDLHDLPDCGLIFISTDDSTALVVKAITKQNFSTIGFFYKTNVSGSVEVKVILVDVYRFTVSNWLGQGASLRDILENNLVNNVAIKGLRPIFDDSGEIDERATQNLYSEFRQAIALVIRNGTETSLREIICQVFGYQVDSPTTGVTPVEMVNRVIASIGKEHQIPQDSSFSAEAIESLKGPAILGNDVASKGKMMQILAANFNQQEIDDPSVANKLIQSYIVENDLFDDLRNLPLPPRDPNKVRQEQEATAILQSDYMAAAVSQFVKMLIHDQGFYQTVVAGFNETRMLDRKKEVNFRHSILDLADDSKELAKLLLRWIHKGEADYCELLSLISKLDDTRECIADRHNIYLSERTKLPIIDRSKMLLLRKDHHRCHDSRYLVGAFLALRDQVNETLSEIQHSSDYDDPVININQMVKNINDMGEALGLSVKQLCPIPGEYSQKAIINITGSKEHHLPLKLKCGKSISLPLHGANLDHFDRQTLLEILEVLDVTASADYRFDPLRRQITYHLAES